MFIDIQSDNISKSSPCLIQSDFLGNKTTKIEIKKDSSRQPSPAAHINDNNLLRFATQKTPAHQFTPLNNQIIKSVGEIETKTVLKTLVQQQFAMIERLKQEIGGPDKLDSYIKRYAKEISNGEMIETAKSKQRPWSKAGSRKETAYELSNTKYFPFKQTISLLLEQYLSNKEHFTTHKFGLQNSHQSPKTTKSQFLTPSKFTSINPTPNTTTKEHEQPQASEEVELRLQRLEAQKRLVTPRIQDLLGECLGHQDIHRFTKAKGHLEKLLNNSTLSDADSECLDPDFWQKVEVKHRTQEKPDIFYMDEEQFRNNYKEFTELANNYEPKQHQKQLASENSKSFSKHFCSKVLSLIQNTQDLESMNWLQQLLEEYSVSETIRQLLQFNQQEIMSAERLDETLGSSNQPRCSVLMLIREEFAKIESLKAGKNRYQMLSRMLSKINYFSHFDCQIRQKLIEISRHSIHRKGTVIINSDELSDQILVVISGAVSVIMKDRNRPADYQIVRHTLYPGDSIGDAPLRLILTSDNLHFHLMAAVDSDILLMKKADVPEILKDEILELLNNKIMPLQSCTLFAGEDHQSPYNIFVLANLVTIRTYQFGEVIQKQGSQADDSMYLIVRGYCRAVFESTIIKLKQKQRVVQFSNSKETYGELGVIMNHKNSVKSDFVIKNLPQNQKILLAKMQPGYLPKPQPLIAKKIQIFDQMSQIQSTLCTEQGEDTKTEISEDSDGPPSCRTMRKEDQAQLVGHYGSKIIDTHFALKDRKVRIIENQPLNITPTIRKIAQLRKHQAKLHFTEPKQDYMSLTDNTRIQTHIDIVQHANQIGKGNIFCARALLEEARSIKALSAELVDFQTSQKVASSNPVKDSFAELNKLKQQIKINDSKLAPEFRQELRDTQEDNSLHAEQITIKGEPKDPAWQQIFVKLRSLLDDNKVKQMTASELFQHLNQSQLTIVADSSDLVLLRIRQQDLSQLSEPVRRRIEREIKNQLFVDFDRPFTTQAQLHQFINQYKKWHKTKHQASSKVLTEKKARIQNRLSNQVNGVRSLL